MAGGSRREWYHSYEWGYSRKLAINNSDQRELERESGERPAGRRARPRALLPRRCSRALLPIGCCPRATSRVFFCRQTWHTHTRSHPHVLHPPHSPVQTKLCRENTDAYPPAGAPAIHRVGTQLYPSPAIPGAAPARAPPRSAGGLTTRPAHDARRRHSPPRPRCLPTRAFRTGTRTPLSLTNILLHAVNTQTIS